jgi:hypothetical protein
MAGSIYDSDFNTPLPNTDVATQLMALRMRNAALDAKPLISCLSTIGNVFTDAAADQRKANTAILQRKIDMLTPEQMESLISQGIDPITEAYKQGIPINIADPALNKVWDADIVNAQKEAGNKWVATVLPVIPYEDRLALLQGDPNVFKKWGLTDFKYVNPEVRNFIQENLLKSTATFEARRQAAKLSPSTAAETGERPVETLFENLPGYVGSQADLTVPEQTAETVRVQALGQVQGENSNSANLGQSVDDSKERQLGGAGLTSAQVSTIKGEYSKRLANAFEAWQRENPKGGYDQFIESSPNASAILTQYAGTLQESGLQDDAQSLLTARKDLIETTRAGAAIDTGRAARANVSTSMDRESAPEIISSDQLPELIEQANLYKRRGWTVDEQNLNDRIDKFITDEVIANEAPELIDAIFNKGKTKTEIETMLTDFNNYAEKKWMNYPKVIEKYKAKAKEYYDKFKGYAADSANSRAKFEEEQADQADIDLQQSAYSTLKAFGKEGLSVKYPKGIQDLSSSALNTIQGTLLKPLSVNVWYQQANPATRKAMAWFALDYAKLLNSESDGDPEKLVEAIRNSPYASGITDQRFSEYIRDMYLVGRRSRKVSDLQADELLATKPSNK